MDMALRDGAFVAFYSDLELWGSREATGGGWVSVRGWVQQSPPGFGR